MGFELGNIILDNNTGIYRVGETVFGKYSFDQKDPELIQGIRVSCIGFCKVHWQARTLRKKTNKSDTVRNHDGYEEYFNQDSYVFGDGKTENLLDVGLREYCFEFPIPSNCPSSYESTHGHIRYQVKVVMVVSGTTTKEKVSDIVVQAPVDLNQMPLSKVPLEFEILNSTSCFCIGPKKSSIRVKLPSGCCPGQPISIQVRGHNSCVGTRVIAFAILNIVTYKESSGAEFSVRSDKLWGNRLVYIQSETSINETVPFDVPNMEVYNFDGCRFIRIEYILHVSSSISGGHPDYVEEFPMIFGTIPLAATEN